jgi:aryl-alcohol dehydrogenase-like predicted oxidoreductase
MARLQNLIRVIMAVARMRGVTPARFAADWARSAGVAASVAPFKGRVGAQI